MFALRAGGGRAADCYGPFYDVGRSGAGVVAVTEGSGDTGRWRGEVSAPTIPVQISCSSPDQTCNHVQMGDCPFFLYSTY